MIISQTPFRISFFGGGSDLREFYSRSPGAVLSAAIDKYMYLTTHPYFDPAEIQLKYSQSESVRSVAAIKHPICRAVLTELEQPTGIEIASIADIPGGTGLGSSSAFTVGLYHNISVRQGRYMPPADLAEKACSIEIDILKEPIGKQDQFASAFGGLNHFVFHRDGRTTADRVFLDPDRLERLERSLSLYYLGGTRSASAVLREQRQRLSEDETFNVQKLMVGQVEVGARLLRDGDLDGFGRLLHEAWTLKKSLTGMISDPTIDAVYERGRAAGALGGKLLGAGGGGFFLFFCPPERQARLWDALKDLRRLPFRFAPLGSQIIHFSQE